MLKLMSQPSTTFMTHGHGEHIDAAHEYGHERERDRRESARLVSPKRSWR